VTKIVHPIVGVPTRNHRKHQQWTRPCTSLHFIVLIVGVPTRNFPANTNNGQDLVPHGILLSLLLVSPPAISPQTPTLDQTLCLVGVLYQRVGSHAPHPVLTNSIVGVPTHIPAQTPTMDKTLSRLEHLHIVGVLHQRCDPGGLPRTTIPPATPPPDSSSPPEWPAHSQQSE
jgi:hypothetical protein